MTDLLTRAASWLVAPRDEAEPEPPTRWLAPAPAPRDIRSPAPVAGRIAVIGPPDDVVPLAASVALAARRQMQASTALVIVWPSSDEDVRSGAAAPTARLLAGRLRRRDLVARARGRLVWLPIAEGVDGLSTGDVTMAMRRAEAAAGHVPSVVAVTAPRDERGNTVLADRDLVVVAAEPASALAVLAVAELEAIGVPALPVAPLPPGLARIAALAGLRPHPFEYDDLDGVLA